MVLSHKDSKPPDKGDTQAPAKSNTSSSTQSPKATPVLYSKIHQKRSKVQESLLSSAREKNNFSSSQPNGGHSVDDPLVIDTVYWGVSQTPGSLFFDVTSRSDSDKELYKAAYMQLGDFVGQLVHRSGPNRYLEVNFDIESHRFNALNNGLIFGNGKVIIKPASAMAPGSILKKVNLQRLPWLRPKELLAGLNATLSNYGRICDIGVVKDNDTGCFLGSGYAILDVSPQLIDKDEPPFLEISHVITWVDPDVSRSGDVFILAYWNDMPTYCKYCHASGHTASGCPKSPSGKRVCFLCLKRGHVRAECPERTSAAKRRRNGKPTLNRNVTSSSVPVDNLSNSQDTVTNRQSQLADEQDSPVFNPSHQFSKYGTIESSCASNPNDGMHSISAQSKAPSPTLTNPHVRPDTVRTQIGQSSHNVEDLGPEFPKDTDMCENTSETESERSTESDMVIDHADPQVLATKSQSTDVSLRRSTRVRNAPDKLNL